ncbi:MAG: hypothetical protein NVSMB18_34150 [Acetobacteraceae bacterium]
MDLRTRLARGGPLAAILFAPALLRLPFWLAGVALSPIWIAAGLTQSAEPAFAPGLPGFMDISAGWITQASGTFAAREWLAGHVPWWDAFSGVGLPLAAEMEGSALFLPYVLLLALPGGYLLLAMALQVTGGLAAYALMRQLGLSRMAATTGALLFEFGGSFAWSGLPYMASLAVLPLILLGLERARDAALRRVPGGHRIIAVALALSLYGGFPETAYLDGLLALAWAVFRLCAAPGSTRRGFALRVAVGGAAALALAAPLLVPFAQLLSEAALGTRATIDMSLLSMPEPGDALYMLPYVLGPIAGYSGHDPSGALLTIWGGAGGYLGVPLALAALLGVAGGRHKRGLRAMLGFWILACLLRNAAVPGLRHLWDLVPALSQVQFFRYSGPSWMLAACLLAAFALDGQRRGERSRRVMLGLGAAVLAAGTAAALWAGWPIVRVLLAAAPGYPAFLWASIGWGAATALLAVALLGSPRPRLAAALLLADAGLLFMVPLLSGPRRPSLDVGSIAFLQQHLGLQRFYTLGPFQANYAGMFGIASINHLYVPLPRSWPDWTRAHLDPRADPVLFMGGFPADEPGQPTHAEAVLAHLDAFAGLGVRYVLAPAGISLSPAVQTSQIVGQASAAVLAAGDSLGLTVPAAALHPGTVSGIGLNLGTYRGHASGPLAVRACIETCASGTLDLAAAQDGGETEITLDPPLPAAEGRALDLTLSHPAGSDVVVWLWPNPGRLVRAASDLPDRAPFLTLHYGLATSLTIVHQSPVMTIYEVPDPAPYFEAPGCAVVPHGRLRVSLQCDRPSRLVRRELWYPGWRSTRDGADQPMVREGALFQAVDVPAGLSTVAFTYRPPGFRAFMLVFLIGAAAVLLPPGLMRRRATGRIG